MKNIAYFVISFEDFLEIVDFNNSLPEEQIAYQMYYVTQLAGLRKDMTPQVISDRLNEQIRKINAKYREGMGTHCLKLATPDSVWKTIVNTPAYFAASNMKEDDTDRKDRQIPYVLTKQKCEELKKQFHFKWKQQIARQRFWNLTINIATWLSLIVLLYVILFYNSNKLGISWPEYCKKTEWTKIDNCTRSVYVLYFITKVIEFREDMTPEVLSARLADLECGYTSPDVIRSFLMDSDLTYLSSKRSNAFIISPKGVDEISDKVGIVSPYNYEGNIDYVWIWKNKPDMVYAVLIAFFSVGAWSFRRGQKVNFICKSKKMGNA